MDRRSMLKSLAATTAILPILTSSANAETAHCDSPACMSDAGAVCKFLSDFLTKEEPNLDHATLIKLMHERGRACCRNLAFRQEMIANSNGSTDKLVELMGKIVGAENCRRSGNQVSLVYPVNKCVCGANPQRPANPNDPYCECSAANNQALFESVSGRPVSVKVLESPRRGGKVCRFDILLG